MKSKITVIFMLVLVGNLWGASGPQTAPSTPSHEIVSDQLEINNDTNASVFSFKGHVRVVNEGFVAIGDKMVVFTNKDSAQNGMSETGSIDKIVADGNVRVDQPQRYITADHADIFPKLGKIVFTGNPVIHENQGTVKGKRITLLQGEKKAFVEGGEEERPTVVLTSTGKLEVGSTSAEASTSTEKKAPSKK